MTHHVETDTLAPKNTESQEQQMPNEIPIEVYQGIFYEDPFKDLEDDEISQLKKTNPRFKKQGF